MFHISFERLSSLSDNSLPAGNCRHCSGKMAGSMAQTTQHAASYIATITRKEEGIWKKREKIRERSIGEGEINKEGLEK